MFLNFVHTDDHRDNSRLIVHCNCGRTHSVIVNIQPNVDGNDSEPTSPVDGDFVDDDDTQDVADATPETDGDHNVIVEVRRPFKTTGAHRSIRSQIQQPPSTTTAPSGNRPHWSQPRFPATFVPKRTNSQLEVSFTVCSFLSLDFYLCYHFYHRTRTSHLGVHLQPTRTESDGEIHHDATKNDGGISLFNKHFYTLLL